MTPLSIIVEHKIPISSMQICRYENEFESHGPWVNTRTSQFLLYIRLGLDSLFILGNLMNSLLQTLVFKFRSVTNFFKKLLNPTQFLFFVHGPAACFFMSSAGLRVLVNIKRICSSVINSIILPNLSFSR